MNKVTDSIRKYKVAVGVIGMAVVGGTVLYLTKGKIDTTKIPISRVKDTIMPPKLDAPEALAKFGVGGVDEYTGAFECMTAFSPNYSVRVGDLGAFGEALCELQGITADSKAFALINIAKS